MKTKTIPEKTCPDCLAHYPDRPGYHHQCDGLMKLLVTKSRNKTTAETEISLCQNCYCMTNTMGGICGKCGAEKGREEWEKQFDKEIVSKLGTFTVDNVGGLIKDFIRRWRQELEKEHLEKQRKQMRKKILDEVERLAEDHFDNQTLTGEPRLLLYPEDLARILREVRRVNNEKEK